MDEVLNKSTMVSVVEKTGTGGLFSQTKLKPMMININQICCICIAYNNNLISFVNGDTCILDNRNLKILEGYMYNKP